MKKTVLILLAGIVLLAGSALCRKPPNEIYYPITVEKIGDFITDLGYKFDKITTTGAEGELSERINLSIRGDNGTYDINVLLFESLEILYIYIDQFMSLPLDDGTSVPMLTYLMSENWDLTFGKFEWDIEDGEIRYSHTLPIDDGMSKETFQAYFNTMLNVADEKKVELDSVFEGFEE